MLKLKNISTVETIYNESDFYIKLKIIFGCRDSIQGRICYWSTLGPKESLIEICLREPTGLIYKITVVSAPTIHNQDAPKTAKEIVIQETGLPLFETDPWQNEGDPSMYYPEHFVKGYYVRERSDFEIYKGEKNVTILFSSNDITLHVINNNVIFGFDANNHLCSIRLDGMTLNNEGFLEEVQSL